MTADAIAACFPATQPYGSKWCGCWLASSVMSCALHLHATYCLLARSGCSSAKPVYSVANVNLCGRQLAVSSVQGEG